MAKTKKRRQGGQTKRETNIQASQQAPQQAPKPLDEMIEVEIDGETYTVCLESFNDVELLDDLNEINKGNPLPTLSVLRRILGKEQAATAIENLRDENGRVGAEATGDFILKLVSKANPNS